MLANQVIGLKFTHKSLAFGRVEIGNCAFNLLGIKLLGHSFITYINTEKALKKTVELSIAHNCDKAE